MSAGAFLHPFTAPRQTQFLRIVGGEGSTVWDDQGNRYIDGLASLWYMNVGHGRPEMVEAIRSQAGKLAGYHTFSPFTNEPAEQIAERIASLSPMGDSRVFLCDSGSEAVDSAMKIARIAQREAGHPERQVIISREHGYHGVNYGGTSAQGIAVNREGFGPLVGGVVNAPAANAEAMAQIFAEYDGEVAAVLTEPVQGAGGVFPPPPGYLESLRQLCDANGAYLIMDEVICGFGRLGEWFGCEHYGVTPDLITFAKAVTSGYQPLGGVIVGPQVRAALEANDGFVLKHGYTYSGHPIASAAGLESIAIHERDGLLARAKQIGERLQTGLFSLLDDGLVAEVRGVGSVWGVEMRENDDPAEVRDGLLRRGVILRPLASSLAICPPLVITDEEIDRIIDALADTLS